MSKNNIVLGTGLAGLSTAWNILEDKASINDKNIKVDILEKTDTIGGMSRTIKNNDFYFDLGPHSVHTVHEDILDFLNNALKGELRKYQLNIKIYFNNKFVTYPLKGLTALTSLSLPDQFIGMLSFVKARIQMLLRQPKNDDSFAEWISNRFGKKLYSIYFGPYAKKTWEIDPSELSNYVAIKRVPVLSISDYLSRLIFKKNRKFHSEDSSVINSYYPKHGSGMIVDYFKNDINKLGGNIHNNVKIESIQGNNNLIQKVIATIDGKERIFPVDFLFSTIPIDEFIKLLQLDVPDEVRNAAEQLDYCSEYLLYLEIKKPKVFDTHLTYFSSPDILFNRIYDVRSFSPDCAPEGKTGLCIEFTCNKNDRTWNLSPAELYEYTIKVFHELNILSDSDVSGYFTKKISHAYPRFRVGFEKNLNSILKYLATLKNTVTLGRQGLFAYANMDDVIKMGFKASYMPFSFKKIKIDYKELFPEYIVF